MTFEEKIKTDAKSVLKSSRVASSAIVFLFLGVQILFLILYSLISSLLKIPEYIFYFDPLSQNSSMPTFMTSALVFLAVFVVLCVIVMVPLFLGIKAWHYSLTSGCSQNILNIFYYFSSFKLFFKSIMLFLNIAIRVVFWLGLFVAVPYVGFELICLEAFKSLPQILGQLGTGIIINIIQLFEYAIMICGAVLTFVISSAYFVSPYYLISDSLSSFRAIRLSKLATKGERKKILKFRLSFIVYDFLELFLIPQLYVLPYKETSFAMYARYLMEKRARDTFSPAKSEHLISKAEVMEESQKNNETSSTSNFSDDIVCDEIESVSCEATTDCERENASTKKGESNSPPCDEEIIEEEKKEE